MAAATVNFFPFFPPPSPHYIPFPPNVPTPPAALPPPPRHYPIPPPPHFSPPPPTPAHPHFSPPPPPHVLPPPPPPGHHSTIIIVVFVSLGGLFFLAFLAAALFCFLSKKRKRTVEKTKITEFDEHIKVQEVILPGPHGEPIPAIIIEDDVHIQEEIHRAAKLGKGSSDVKSSVDYPHHAISSSATSSSPSDHHLLEHKP